MVFTKICLKNWYKVINFKDGKFQIYLIIVFIRFKSFSNEHYLNNLLKETLACLRPTLVKIEFDPRLIQTATPLDKRKKIDIKTNRNKFL